MTEVASIEYTQEYYFLSTNTSNRRFPIIDIFLNSGFQWGSLFISLVYLIMLSLGFLINDSPFMKMEQVFKAFFYQLYKNPNNRVSIAPIILLDKKIKLIIKIKATKRYNLLVISFYLMETLANKCRSLFCMKYLTLFLTS